MMLRIWIHIWIEMQTPTVTVASNAPKMLLLKNLSNHTRYYHILPDYINSTRYLGGICVDPDRGIYMIRRSFSGTSHPLHVLHNFGVNGGFSCELNDCRELSNTTKRSGNPNFICNHLKSVQYINKNSNSSYILPQESLKALINKVTWFKRSREEENCMTTLSKRKCH